MKKPKFCPQCEYVFRRGTLAGIDFHWKFNHRQIARYEDVRLSILTGRYKRKDPSVK
jgi:hypothetical protein